MTERHEYYVKGQELLKEPLHYTLCGLPNIYLLNGVVFHEDEGYGPSYEIQDMDGLHDVIAAHIVLRTGELMTGAELRFLRKRMNMTQEELAKMLSISEQTVANYEKGQTAVTGPYDFSIRMIYTLHVLPPDAGKAFLDELARAVREKEEAHNGIVPIRTDWNEVRLVS